MRNDNDRNPKDFYGKTEAELRKLNRPRAFPREIGNALKNVCGKKTAGPINLRKHCIKPA